MNGFVLASNISTSNGKTYILRDPENGAACNVRSKDRVLGDPNLVSISSQSLSFDVSKQHIAYGNEHMRVKQHQLASFRPELSYVDGLNAIWECHLALSKRKRSCDSIAAALIEEGVSLRHSSF